MSDRTFTFKSGYTLRVWGDYTPAVLQMAMERWTEENPRPMPPTKSVPIKNGTREIPQNNDATFLLHSQVWANGYNSRHDRLRLILAIDPDSIDPDVVEAARLYATERGTEISDSDVLVYIHTVAQRGKSVPGKPEYVEDERDLLEAFIDNETGPSEALVTHLLRTKFLDKVSGNGHLDVQANAESGT